MRSKGGIILPDRPKIRIGLSKDQEADLLDRAEKMFNGVKITRSEYETDWKELAKYFAPHLYRQDGDPTATKKSKWSSIINNTGRMAVRTLQSGMQSGLTNKSKPWFRLGLEDFEMTEWGPVREWLDITTKRMQTIFTRSNMYNTAVTYYGVAATFGTAARLQLFDFQDVMRFDMMMTGRYWIGLNARKRVDRLFYIRDMTTVQMAEEFGLENLPENIKGQFEKGDYFMVTPVMVGIFPNPYVKWNRDGRTIVASNQKPFVSVHWVNGEKRVLKTAGYDRFPAQVTRWETTDTEVWGIGCGHDAIGDTKATQLKEREKAKGIQKMVSPPTSAPAEMRNAQFPISGLPGGVTYRPPNTAPDAITSMYQVNLPLNYLYEDIRIDEGRVNRAFYADLFLMLAQSDRRDITAYEIAERKEEKLLALGPVVENVDNEFLDPTIERAFEIIVDNNLVPPPPPEINEMSMKVEYISLLAQAQKQVGIGAIEHFLSFTGNANALFPEKNVGDKVDVDQALDEVANMLGVPQGIVVTDDRVAEMRQSRSDQIQQQQAMQTGMAGVQAAKTLSETPIGSGGTILDALAGA